MRVAACQLPDVRDDVPRALSLIETYVEQAALQGARLVCFPECFLQGYHVDMEHIRDSAIDFASADFKSILQKLRRLEPAVVFGVVERNGAAIFNSAVIVEHGELIGRYRKSHLLDGEQAIFSSGDRYPVFDVGGLRVGINICYDLNFADSVQAVALARADLVVCPCSNMMGREKAEKWKHVHNEVRTQRAREASVWLLSSDVTGERDGRICYGPTAVIDPTGVVVDQVPLMTTGLVYGEIQ